MSREEFVQNYLRTEDVVLLHRHNPLPEERVIFALIGSIYDLQQQIAQLQEKVDE